MSKVILVTGGSSGIGRAIASYVNEKNNYVVYGSSRNIKKLDDVAFMPIELDVTSEKSINDCVEKVIREYGKIDVLINCIFIVASPTQLAPD